MNTTSHLDISADDIVLPFQIDPFAMRGRVVRLGSVVDSVIKRHNYPPLVARTLAEMIAMAAALAATLKYDGVFTLQTKGDGPIRMMLADVTSAGAIRGYAQYDAERLADLGEAPSVPKLFGAGYLAFTVDQGEHTERYQGIVELTGATLAECAHHYFRQSEQFKAGLKVAVARQEANGESQWRAGAIMIQSLPPEGAQGSAEGRDLDRPLTLAQEEAEDGWRRALILMGSATAAELVDPDLPPWRLVDRLFLAEGVKIYRPHDLRHSCRCSRERVARVLRAFPREEIEDLEVDGALVVTCEFCNESYAFDRNEVAALYDKPQ